MSSILRLTAYNSSLNSWQPGELSESKRVLQVGPRETGEWTPGEVTEYRERALVLRELSANFSSCADLRRNSDLGQQASHHARAIKILARNVSGPRRVSSVVGCHLLQRFGSLLV